MKDQRIDLGEVAIQIRQYEYEGDAIIFLHFGGGNLMMWRDIVPFFEGRYHLILFDLKGHGKSDKPKTGYHIDELAGEVLAVLDQLDVSKTHIVGSSLGAEIGLSLAANYPDRVLSLVLGGALFSEAGPYGLWGGTDEEFEAHAAERLEKLKSTPPTLFASIDELIAASQAAFEEYGWWSDTFAEVKRYDAIQTEDGQYRSSWGIIAADYTQHYLFCRVEDYYRRLQCPILMLADTYPGQDDREKDIMHGLFDLAGKRGQIVAPPEWVHPFGWMLTPQPVSEAILSFYNKISTF